MHLISIRHGSSATLITSHGAHHLLCHLYHLRVFHHLLYHGIIHHVGHIWWHTIHTHTRHARLSHAWLATSSPHGLILHSHLLPLLSFVDRGTESDVFDFFYYRILFGTSARSRAGSSLWLFLCLRSRLSTCLLLGCSLLSVSFLCLLHHIRIALHHV